MGSDLYLTIGDKKINMGRVRNYIGQYAFYMLETPEDREAFENLLEALTQDKMVKLMGRVGFTPTTFSDHRAWLSDLEDMVNDILEYVRLTTRLQVLCELLADEDCGVESR